MSPRLAQRLLIAQTLLLVLVLWGGVYFARDEFQLATEAEEEAIPTTDHLRDAEAAVPQVVLSETALRQVDLQLAAPQAGSRQRAHELRLQVLDPQALLAPRQAWRAAQAAREEARLEQATAQREAARMQALHADEQQVSTRALEAAQAAQARAGLRLEAAEAALRAAVEGARTAWGPQVGAWLVAPEGSPGAQAWARLLDGRDVLLRAAWPAAAEVPAGARLLLRGPVPLDTPEQPRPTRRAEALGAAPAAAMGEPAPGLRPLLFRAEGRGLSVHQQLSGRLVLAGAAVAGAWVPASALIWHAGQPWVYVVETPAEGPAGAEDAPEAEPASASAAGAGTLRAFRRQARPGAERESGTDGRWFLPGFDAGRQVVVRGAQLLLSEEQKGLLKNENDD